MISKTSIKFRTEKKTNPELSTTIALALKHPKWHKVAQILSASTRKHSSVNLDQIDRLTTPGDTVVIPGKVLSNGELTKKVRICALSFSPRALEKLKSTKSEAVNLITELQKNPKGEGIKLIQ